jgi:DNA-binding transcriptional ArsR family regulator
LDVLGTLDRIGLSRYISIVGKALVRVEKALVWGVVVEVLESAGLSVEDILRLKSALAEASAAAIESSGSVPGRSVPSVPPPPLPLPASSVAPAPVTHLPPRPHYDFNDRLECIRKEMVLLSALQALKVIREGETATSESWSALLQHLSVDPGLLKEAEIVAALLSTIVELGKRNPKSLEGISRALGIVSWITSASSQVLRRRPGWSSESFASLFLQAYECIGVAGFAANLQSVLQAVAQNAVLVVAEKLVSLFPDSEAIHSNFAKFVQILCSFDAGRRAVVGSTLVPLLITSVSRFISAEHVQVTALRVFQLLGSEGRGEHLNFLAHTRGFQCMFDILSHALVQDDDLLCQALLMVHSYAGDAKGRSRMIGMNAIPVITNLLKRCTADRRNLASTCCVLLARLLVHDTGAASRAFVSSGGAAAMIQAYDLFPGDVVFAVCMCQALGYIGAVVSEIGSPTLRSTAVHHIVTTLQTVLASSSSGSFETELLLALMNYSIEDVNKRDIFQLGGLEAVTTSIRAVAGRIEGVDAAITVIYSLLEERDGPVSRAVAPAARKRFVQIGGLRELERVEAAFRNSIQSTISVGNCVLKLLEDLETRAAVLDSGIAQAILTTKRKHAASCPAAFEMKMVSNVVDLALKLAKFGASDVPESLLVETCKAIIVVLNVDSVKDEDWLVMALNALYFVARSSQATVLNSLPTCYRDVMAALQRPAAKRDVTAYAFAFEVLAVLLSSEPKRRLFIADGGLGVIDVALRSWRDDVFCVEAGVKLLVVLGDVLPKDNPTLRSISTMVNAALPVYKESSVLRTSGAQFRELMSKR